MLRLKFLRYKFEIKATSVAWRLKILLKIYSCDDEDIRVKLYLIFGINGEKRVVTIKCLSHYTVMEVSVKF